MLSRITHKHLASLLSRSSLIYRQLPRLGTAQFSTCQTRRATPHPSRGEMLMGRRADRELPDIETVSFRWRRTFPFFMVIIVATSLAIFNYQKSSSPVVASTLYALRTSPVARAHLGDEIYFAHSIPWISGEMNQLQGRIDIRFRVRGSRAAATLRFASFRTGGARGLFETTDWCLELDDGTIVDLLDQGDPFRALAGVQGDLAEDPATRGFRQMPSKKEN